MLQLPAVVTAEQARAVLKTLLKALDGHASGGPVMLDASGLQRLDSSCVALLLALRRHAQTLGFGLLVNGATPSLLALIRAYGLESLLNTEPLPNAQ